MENFEKIPILTKKIIREEFENLKSKNLKNFKWEYNTSGGSSGEPARFIQDNNYKSYNIANKMYLKILAGAQIGGKELRFWGSERDILEGKEDLKIILRNKIYNRFEINMFKLNYSDIPKHLDFWNKYKPEWIEAYVHIMYEFAKYAIKYNIKVYAPKGILCTAGSLDFEMRKTIEKAFNIRVFNRYGSREVGDIACEDKTNLGLRISVWNNKLEILDSNMKPTKELGKIYITNLNNYAMPLIRYEIGDMGIKASKWGYLKEINGRITSIFKTKEGGFFDGCYFRTILSYKDWIKQFQIIQTDYDEIVYNIVPMEKNFKIPLKEKKEISKNVQKLLGKNCKVKFNIVNKIDNLKSGKYLYTRSEIK
ncbi:phenylacetate--CoA ligase family protein [bacterium]|nr:phenylacetate--CoA ligase family protein [bacterium]